MTRAGSDFFTPALVRFNVKQERDEKMATELEYAKENDYVWYFDMLVDATCGAKDRNKILLDLYYKHWEKVKRSIVKDYFQTLADGGTAKPSPRYMMSLRDSNFMFYGNTINDIDNALNSTCRYDDRVSFAKDCLEIFDLEDDRVNYDLMNFQLAIGEALSDGGHAEESDAYYEKLLAENPGNGYMIANYVLTLKTRGEKERARKLLEQHINPDMEPTENNDMLFERARELYDELGDRELARHYAELQKKIGSFKEESAYRLSDEYVSQALANAAKTKIKAERKIYPNDPCPCGSGKKYKKCCGRNA